MLQCNVGGIHPLCWGEILHWTASSDDNFKFQQRNCLYETTKMKGIRIALLSISTVISAQSVSDVLLRYPELSKLSSYVPAFPEWSASLEAANNFTLLAPSNDAISTWLAASSPPNSTIVATLLYHLLEGSRPLTSFNNQSIFIPTALSNATYANVTGGQRVLATNDGHLAFESGNKTTSNVTTAVGPPAI